MCFKLSAFGVMETGVKIIASIIPPTDFPLFNGVETKYFPSVNQEDDSNIVFNCGDFNSHVRAVRSRNYKTAFSSNQFYELKCNGFYTSCFLSPLRRLFSLSIYPLVDLLWILECTKFHH